MRIHRSRSESARRQSDARPEAWESTCRPLVLYNNLAADMELGFFLAYYRTFAIPSRAATLHQNREIIELPIKRSYDTAIVTYGLITSGLNSDRGRHTIRLLNHTQRHVPGSPNDFLYALLTLLAGPLTRPVLSAMFDDDRLTDAQGLPQCRQTKQELPDQL